LTTSPASSSSSSSSGGGGGGRQSTAALRLQLISTDDRLVSDARRADVTPPVRIRPTVTTGCRPAGRHASWLLQSINKILISLWTADADRCCDTSSSSIDVFNRACFL